MASYNRVTLIGNLTRDPELRYTPGGSSVCEFAIAVNRKWKGKDGQDREEVSFIDCLAWAKTGENIAEWFKKGKPIFIDGRLQQDRWQDKNTGSSRSRLRVVVDRWQFIGGKDAGGESAPPEMAADVQVSEEDIPF